MAEKMRELRCPDCGKKLEVPAELEEFSCLYCGRRIRRAEVKRPAAADGGAADYEYAREHLAACVLGQRALRGKFSQADYEPAFLQYEKEHGEVFRCLDAACRADQVQASARIDELAEALLEALEADWAASRHRSSAAEDDKFVIALFLIPMVRRCGGESGEVFARRLHAVWMERYPRNPFALGDYETILGGFRKKYLGLCFITTAVCRREGKPDDCAELTAFRRFRDGYLRTCPDGPALIREYYELAPAIVTLIDVCGDPERDYGEIRDRWLTACYRDLEAGRPADCKRRYQEMVRTLERRWLH